MNKFLVFGLGVGAGIALTCIYSAYKKSMNKMPVVEKSGDKPIEGTLQTPSKKEEEKK